MKKIKLSNLQESQIRIFKENFLRFSDQFNLCSGNRGAFNELLEDSLISAGLLSPFFSSSPVLDLGSGNGFPGLICGILYPKTPFVLCERNRKRAEFLKQALFHVKCPNVQVLCRAAEDLKSPFPLVLSKATGPFHQVLKVLEKILEKDGFAVFWKSPGWEKTWPKKMPFSVQEISSYLSAGKRRTLLCVRRKSNTE